jgi:hypothetical protein
MRNAAKFFVLFGLLSLTAFAADSKTSGSQGDSLIITFKDGHQQSFPVADVARIEFKTSPKAAATASTPASPSRNNYMGKWRVGDGAGNTFIITLDKNGHATKSIGGNRGTWSMVDGEAHINWEDGWHDAIRRVGNKYEKVAYGPGKSFSDQPDNTADAKSLEPI